MDSFMVFIVSAGGASLAMTTVEGGAAAGGAGGCRMGAAGAYACGAPVLRFTRSSNVLMPLQNNTVKEDYMCCCCDLPMCVGEGHTVSA